MSVDKVQLEFKDRLSYVQLIDAQLKAIEMAIANPKVTIKTIQKMMLSLLTNIPDNYKDQQFENEMKKVLVKKPIDNRPKFAGKRVSYEYCRKRNIKPTINITVINYFRLKNAIMNLFDRRGLLIRKEKIEMTSGINLKFKTIEDFEEQIERMSFDDADTTDIDT